MRPKLFIALLLALGVLAALITVYRPSRTPSSTDTIPVATQVPASTVQNEPLATLPEQVPLASSPRSLRPALGPREPAGQATNKLERLAQTREQFRALAAGEPVTALQAAKQIKDETERETALLALVTEWTQGELRPPRERARSIELYGLEAGLGMELAKSPELALTWANELTDGQGRQGVLTQTALALTGTDPAAAFALGAQLPQDQQRRFFDSVFTGWAGKDTESALQWANQLPDSADQTAALQAIRSAAPVGIGTAITIKDGMPTVAQLFPGTPAELSGQIHAGDRILALAQGDNTFVNAQGIPLSDLVQMIRGEAGTSLQLQILPAGAAPDSAPQTISIIRDQIKFKR